MKHHTSKISSYSDLLTLETFGFRGEALSSLCALAQISIVTCLAQDAPKARRLEFETSGKLKENKVVAAQKGTTVIVHNLFGNLPVRRRDLERNIKREWSKVTNVLGQYACIQTGIKFSVSHQTDKGKKTTVFSTKGNLHTKENIVNVFGAKMLTSLLPLDLELELEEISRYSRKANHHSRDTKNKIRIVGHISRPTSGENRQIPDRQMFFVNMRPCNLPHIYKALNEIYKSFNGSSPVFIFANLELDTRLYDVNVSPDKRTILLHNQSGIIEALRVALSALLESRNDLISISRFDVEKQPFFRQSTINYDRKSSVPRKPSINSAYSKKNVLEEGLTPSKKEVLEIDDLHRDSYNQNDLFSGSNIGLPTSSCEDVNSTSTGAENSLGFIVTTQAQDLQPTLNPLKSTPDKVHKGFEHDNIENSPSGAINHTMQYMSTPRSKTKRLNSSSFLYENLSEMPHSKKTCRAENCVTNTESSSLEFDSSQEKSPSIDNKIFNKPFLRDVSPDVKTIKNGDQTIIYTIGTPCPSRTHSHKNILQNQASSPELRTRSKNHSNFGRNLSRILSVSNSTNPSLDCSDANKLIEIKTEELTCHNLSQNSSTTNESLFESDCEKSEAVSSSQSSNPTVVYDELQPVASLCATQECQHPDEHEMKLAEEAKVQELIQDAENTTKNISQESIIRSKSLLKGLRKKDSTLNLVQIVNTNLSQIKHQFELLQHRIPHPNKKERFKSDKSNQTDTPDLPNGSDGLKMSIETTEINELYVSADGIDDQDADEKLSLTVSKSDFGKMKIIGQFNLGFIIIFRSADSQNDNRKASDELFIIDQHASDEKYNFERLQATTILQSQKLAVPKPLKLTVLEEEVVIDNLSTLRNNGFVVSVDHSGDRPAGNRCELTTLPLSRETTFSLADLEELISLLLDYPCSTTPRPSRVLKMLAMRACRSSIMIGKTLTLKQMEKIVTHLGELDKPWNCPHGRPTMRHLCGLSQWDAHCWKNDMKDIGYDLLGHIAQHRKSFAIVDTSS